MIFSSTSRSSSSGGDDELPTPESPFHRDRPNAMSSFNHPTRTSPPSDSSTLSNPWARMFPSPERADTGTLGVAANTFGSAAANTLGYPFNTSTHLAYSNHYMGSNILSNRDYPYCSEEATTTHYMMVDIARSQNYHPTADPMHYTYYELQPSSGHGDPVHNSPSWHGAQYHNTAPGAVDAWYPNTSATGGNPPPSYIPPMQYSDARPQYVSPNICASSSSHREPSSAHYPEAYHDSWQRCENHAICDPQIVGSSLPEQPDPSMAPLPPAAIFSHTHISHGDDISNPSHRLPSIRPHQDLPSRNSRSRQNSRRHRRSNPYGTHHSPSPTFSCGWLIGENMTCTYEGPLDAFKAHFRGNHLSGGQDAPNVCCWQGCEYRKRDNADIHFMRRDSAWRHVWETHLGMKRNT